MEVHEFSVIVEPGANVSESVVDFHSDEYPALSVIIGTLIDSPYTALIVDDPNVNVR